MFFVQYETNLTLYCFISR